MVFVRFKGPYAYLVMNERVRERGRSRVRQRVLYYLGKDPRITEEVISEFEKRYPDVEVDWDGLTSGLPGEVPEPEEDEDDWLSWD